MDLQGIKQLIDKLNTHTAVALEAAAGFAASRSHFEVLPEHLLIKLMEEGENGDIEQIFHFFQIDQDAVWHQVLDYLNKQPSGSQSKPVFSRRLYEWLEKSWLCANMHHQGDWITGAALVDSLQELLPFSQALGLAGLFDKLDVNFLRQNLNKICAKSCERHSVKQTQVNANTTSETTQTSQALRDYCEDLTNKAQQGEIDPVLGRNDEIRMMIDVLCRRRKNNPILVGDPGVGKTAVVEGLAQRIIDAQVPDELKGVKLLTLDMGLLQAGAGVKGEFERRLKQVIDEIKSSATPIIMFIDEAHTLIGAGGDAGMSDAANLLKPALARGELRTVAATTWSEYKKYFERDAALERRFQLIKIDEPSEQAAKLMLTGLKAKYQQHHNIQITDAAIEAAVTLSSRYITGRQLPDKAIDVLDTAAARVRMSSATIPAAIESEIEHIAYLTKRLENLSQEKSEGLAIEQDIINTMQIELNEAKARRDKMQLGRETQLATLTEINALKQNPSENNQALLEKRTLLKQQNEEGNSLFSEVDADSVAVIIAQWTGIPVGSMVKDEITTLINLENALTDKVIGQNEGINKIAQSLRVAKAGVSTNEGPLGVFLLAGPSGVGKTQTARELAKALFGGDKFLTTINMSEYQESHTVSQLKGSPPGYVGFGEGGVLTEAVRQRPYSVVLLDEVEKAHPDVMNVFYQVFERGFMRDGEGREIDFRNTVIVMTSNLGSQTLIDSCMKPMASEVTLDEDNGEFSQQIEQLNTSDETQWQRPKLSELLETIKPELLAYFAPALLARMQTIAFVPLDKDALTNIVSLKLEAIATRLNCNHNMAMRVDASVISHLADKCQLSDSGARMVNSIIEQQILPGIAKSVLEFMAQEDLPDMLTLCLDDDNEIQAVFADLAKSE
ncbi:type VI secretion system ATPase TssH [Pseudoalteromonas denitrificans]|uniref:Type VI secretion system protein VasG n=1 Tax=Pseudoalteromonas denitrificans DSM 6059 TaxID=1123010 RepID=A0A1I1NEL9_9GAMM|nr:type VI secretion system ATPase TssH [Pseudoalteromonas denitrificans]SFC95846.1 type VI secretion system protein VasG [Pseudoalteromonas denitrificans DSM 6059]